MQKTTFFVQNVNHQVHIRHCPEVKTEFCQTFSKPCFSAKMHHFNKKILIAPFIDYSNV